MTLSKIVYKIGSLRKEIEFLLITNCLLLFPNKTSYAYFLACSIVIGFFLLKEIIFAKNVAVSGFSTTLFFIILIFSVSVFFSVYKLKSFLLVTDIFLICFYFFIFYFDRNDETRYFRLIMLTISLFSVCCILNGVFSFFREKNIFFENPILQGIVSGIGVIIAIFFLLKSFKPLILVHLVINTIAVYISASKAAFLGILIFGLVMVVLRKKWLVPIIIVLTIMTFVIPNPVRNLFYSSLKHDPYLLNRIDIWKLSGRILKDHFFTGVGPDNFSELSKKYNFKQEKGPANYFKIPRSTHNDYLKIMVETGLIGLIGLICLLLLFLRKLFSGPLFNLSKILLLYFLFQALLFNFIFQFFFLFLLIFLVKNLFEKNTTFTTLNFLVKWLFVGLVVIVFVFSYLFPFLSDSCLVRSRVNRDFIQAFDLIKKAEFFNPFSHGVYYSKALLFLDYFDRTSQLDSFYYGIENAKKAQRINKNYLPAYLLEFEFFKMVLKKKLKYTTFIEESLIPLEQAEKISPFNPFIPLIKAQLYLEFNQRKKAKIEALRALEIEPDYVSAHYFLQDNFDYFGNPTVFKEKINVILKKAKKYPYEPGSYLDDLFKVPRSVR
jgi:tetratricopeptide (TPR) repeat protein